MSTIMAQEIAEQPAVLTRTLESLMPLRPGIAAAAKTCRSVLLIARGSSDNAAVYGRYLLETHSGIRAGLGAPSVGTHYSASVDLSDVLVVSISQSGETEEIVASQEWAKGRGARTIAVTNHPASTLATNADFVLATRADTERAVPATKTYTSQLVAMAVIATALGTGSPDIDGALWKAPQEIERLITERAGVDEAIAVMAATDDVLVSGRGLLMGTALEIALKLEETCLRPVRGMSYADLRHGPIAAVSDKVVAILVSAMDGPMTVGMEALALDLANRGTRATIGIGGTVRFSETCDVSVGGALLPESVAPIAAVVPGQLIAEGLSRHLGLNPDLPTGLNKVTQTDPATR